MKTKLYNIFNKWSEEGTIWLYSDPHFGDVEHGIAFRTISSDKQVKNINSKVGKKDTIIFLGDIGDAEYIKKIRGYKVLIKGNHDLGNSHYQRQIFARSIEHWGELKLLPDEYIKNNYIMYDNKLFDEVYEGPLFISKNILLSHEPIDYPYAMNIHGHDHGNKYQRDDTHINICAEFINFTPVSLDELMKNGNKAKDIHRDTIDKAIERKIEKVGKI